MFKSYLTIAIRNLKRHSAYSFINLAGFAISMVLFFLIYLFIKNELSSDSFQKNLAQIYKLGRLNHEHTDYGTATHPPVAQEMKTSYPEIIETVRLHYWNGFSQRIQYKEKSITLEDLVYVDQSIFDIFTFEVIQGDLRTALSQPYSLVLTESESRKIFRDENPIGKVIRCEVAVRIIDFTVTAIVKDMPSNSTLQYNALASFVSLVGVRNKEYLTTWDDPHCETYLLLNENCDVNNLQEKMNKEYEIWSQQRWGTAVHDNYKLYGLKELYFSPSNIAINAKHGNLQQVFVFIAIGIMILLIAIINFINLSTARASLREKEVGIKKVVGSHRIYLVAQFLCESIILCTISMILAASITEFLLPKFNSLIGTNIAFNFIENPFTLLLIFGSAVIIGILAGIYPAFYLTVFNPVEVLKGTRSKETKGSSFRKGLIAIQFTMSIILIICAITIARQNNFMKHKDLGFQKNHILWFNLNSDLVKNFDPFYEKLKNCPGIEGVSFSGTVPGELIGGWVCKYEGNQIDARTLAVDPDYMKLMGLELVEGRNFSWDIKSDQHEALIFNETAIKELGLDSPLGVTIPGRGIIIGVVKDFHFKSLHQKIQPMVMIYKLNLLWFINVKVPTSNLSETIKNVETIYDEFSPNLTFEYHFLDESFDRLYKSDERFAEKFIYFSIFAIFIACLGLFGLAAFIAECRTKEIGIRKVLGASVPNIVTMLTKDFAKWVLIANIIAWPIAYFAMNKWLQNFAYRINMNWWMFALAGALVLVIALLTVSWQAIRAATANPVEALRYE